MSEVPEAGPLKIVIPDAVRKPPSAGVLLVVALGTIALGIAAVVFFLKNRDRVLGAEDAGVVVGANDANDANTPGTTTDGSPGTIDAGTTATDAGTTVTDAGTTVTDAGTTVTTATDAAKPATAIDAGVMRPDAGALVLRDARDATGPAGEATLKVGADPWGEIVIDGAPRGRTPAELVVPAGKHTVVVIFRGVEPAVEKSFTVDLATGEVETLHADFR